MNHSPQLSFLHKYSFFVVLLTTFSVLNAQVQMVSFNSEKSNIDKYFSVLPENFFDGTNSSEYIPQLDTIIQPKIKPQLLPKNMSLMEKAVWGESGILRGIGLAPELTPEVRKSELNLRRFMLSAHQIGGFVTLGLMIATAYYGQRVIDGERNLGETKQTLASLTVASYTLTGLLSILSPPPLIRRDDETSTTTLHKTLAWIHVAGMIATPILASYIQRNRQFNMSAARVHQVAGYLTTAVFALSMAVVTF